MVRLTNNSLLPDSIQQYLSTIASPHIADVGTGSGIWLKDPASQLPSSSVLTGFDIDPSKFPPLRSIPRNVTLRFGNILEPFLDDLKGTYDLVHIRFLEATYWEEAGYPSWITIPPSRAWYELLDCARNYAVAHGLDVTAPVNLLTHVQTANFTSCFEKNFHTISVPSLNRDMREAFSRGWAQKAYGIVSRGGVEGLRTNVDAQELLRDLERDFEGGVQACMELKWVWGRHEEA